MTTWDDGQEQLHDELLDFTIVGAYHIARGLTEFSAWSKAMLAEKCSGRNALRLIQIRLTASSLEELTPASQENSPQARIADSSFTNAVSFTFQTVFDWM